MRRRQRWVVVLSLVAGVLVWLLWRARSQSAVSEQPATTNDDQRGARTADSPEARRTRATTGKDAQGSLETDAGDRTSSTARIEDGGTPFDIIGEIRAVLVEAPKLAEELARTHQERFPDAPDADERDALLVAAIYNQHQPDRAKFETRQYLRRHPNGRYAAELMRVTGAHVPVPVLSSPP